MARDYRIAKERRAIRLGLGARASYIELRLVARGVLVSYVCRDRAIGIAIGLRLLQWIELL